MMDYRVKILELRDKKANFRKHSFLTAVMMCLMLLFPALSIFSSISYSAVETVLPVGGANGRESMSGDSGLKQTLNDIRNFADQNAVSVESKVNSADNGETAIAATDYTAVSERHSNNIIPGKKDDMDLSPAEQESSEQSSAITMMSADGGGENDGTVFSGWDDEPIQISRSGNSGAATTKIPIIAPPGRNGMQPNLSLRYNSGAGNGWIGVGWDLDIGAVQRSARRGVDYAADDYVISINGSTSELTPRNDWGTNFYGAKIESNFSRYYHNTITGGWEMTGKDGTKYYFGSSAVSRQDDPADPLKIFKWCLDRMEDTNGNYIEVTYVKDRGAIYPEEIKYTGNTAGLTPSNSVKFILEPSERTDAYEVFTTHFSVTTAYRLQNIEVYGNGGLARSYGFQYQYSSGTGRSLLADVIQYGSSGGEFLRSTFNYYPISENFNYSVWSQNYFGISPVGILMTGDFNGDGTCDTSFSFTYDFDGCRNDCQQTCEPDCTYSCENICEDECQDMFNNCEYNCQGDCENFCEDECSEDIVCDIYCQNEDDYDTCFESCLDDPYDLVDACKNICEGDCLNSCQDLCWDAWNQCEGSCDDICWDQCTEICDDSCDQACWDACGDYCGWYPPDDNTWVGLSTSSSINYNSWHQGELYANPYDTLGSGDIDGDGKSDIVFYENGNTWVGISSGTGFTYTIWSQNSFGTQPDDTFRTGDFNGDGLSDVVFYYEDGNTWVGLSGGTSLTYSIWSADSFGTQPYETFRTGDFNGDGLSDVVFYYENGNTWVGISNGSSFTYSIWSTDSFGTQPYETFRTGDFNGDGLSDIAFYYEDGNTWVGISNGSGFTYTSWSQNGFGTQPYKTFSVGDFNGDGLSDVVFYYEDGNTWVGISNGNSFTYNIWSSNGFGTNPKDTFRTGDFNGDGKSDVAYYYEDGSTWIGISGSEGVPDLLNTVSNTLGSTTTITYQPSSVYNNTLLPFIVQNVSAISVNDGRGNTSTAVYDYSGGYFDHAEREFRGFGYVKSTDPAGTDTETWFQQDVIFKGLISELTISKSGNIYTKTEYVYDATIPYAGVNFPRLIEKNNYICDGFCNASNIDTEALKSAEEFDYDGYGNLVWKYSYGDTSISGDEKEEYTEYYLPGEIGEWLVSLPKTTYIKNSTGDTKAQKWFTYYTGTGNLLTERRWLETGSDPVTTYEEYDAYGNIKKVRDPGGYLTEITCDPATHTYQWKLKNQLNHTTEKTYDYRFGKVLTDRDLNDNTTSYDYDEFGRVTRITKPAPYGITGYFYNNFGSPDQRIRMELQDRQGGVLKWKETYFDGLGRTTQEKHGGPGVSDIITDTEYNNKGLVASRSNPHFSGDTVYETIYTYDPLDRMTHKQNSDGTSASMECDRGRTTSIDENSHKRVEAKDIYGNLIKEEEYTGNSPSTYALYVTTTYDHDVLNNPVYVVDNSGNETFIEYNTLSGKVSADDPDTGLWEYDYDANGNLTYQKDAKGQEILFEYDEINRVRKKTYPDGSYIEYKYDETFSTNAVGRLTTVTQFDSLGEAILKIRTYYDEAGLITRTDREFESEVYTIRTQYDVLERIIKLIYPDSTEVDYTYDGHGRIEEIRTGGRSYIVYNAYNAFSQPLSVTFGNGAVTTYQYYPDNNRLFTITSNGQTTALINLEYHYDDAGNIIQIIDNINSSKSRTYAYDELDRLTESDSPAYGGKLIYQYNAIGNITYNCRYGYYYYDDPDHVHAVTKVRKSDGTLLDDYAYDNNGNMISGAGRGLVYDMDNRPVSITYSGSETTAIYDADGSRIKKVTPAESTIYIGQSYECTNDLCTRHIFSGTQLMASIRGTDTYYYHTDHLGSSSVITDSDGQGDEIVQDLFYYPYGEIKTNTGTVDLHHKFSGKEWDGDTGLYYYGTRYYDPRLARWITADPMHQHLNLYMFCRNNPVVLKDPNGDFDIRWDFGDDQYFDTENGWIEWDREDSGLNGYLTTDSEEFSFHLGGNFWATSDGLKLVLDYRIGEALAEAINMGADLTPFFGDAKGFAEAWEGHDFLGNKLATWERAISFLGMSELRKLGNAGEAIYKASGQVHHLLSTKIMRGLNKHEVLRGVFNRNDSDFLYRAIDLDAHKGYQTWHREVDDIAVEWLQDNRTANKQEFMQFLHDMYQSPDISGRIPDVDLLDKTRK